MVSIITITKYMYRWRVSIAIQRGEGVSAYSRPMEALSL
jgi:hypothetical protein